MATYQLSTSCQGLILEAENLKEAFSKFANVVSEHLSNLNESSNDEAVIDAATSKGEFDALIWENHPSCFFASAEDVTDTTVVLNIDGVEKEFDYVGDAIAFIADNIEAINNADISISGAVIVQFAK